VNKSNSNSNSTHATLASASDVVKELRELSALDSSSFEEESRFLLTSFLFRFVRRLIPGSNKLDENKSDDQEEQEERAFDEISENSPVHEKEDDMPAMDNQVFVGPREECDNERIIFTALRYIAFVFAFIFWPTGIVRRAIHRQPYADLYVYRKRKQTSRLY